MNKVRSFILLAVVVSVAVLSGCSAAPASAPVTVTAQPSAAAPAAPAPKTTAAPAPVTVTQPAPVTVTQAAPSTVIQKAPTVIVQQAPPVTVVQRDRGLTSVYDLPGGLLCADLKNGGYTSYDAFDYWAFHQQPSNMDADNNGIPCETVWAGGAWPGHSDQ